MSPGCTERRFILPGARPSGRQDCPGSHPGDRWPGRDPGRGPTQSLRRGHRLVRRSARYSTSSASRPKRPRWRSPFRVVSRRTMDVGKADLRAARAGLTTAEGAAARHGRAGQPAFLAGRISPACAAAGRSQSPSPGPIPRHHQSGMALLAQPGRITSTRSKPLAAS